MKEERKQEVARRARARQETIRKRVEASKEIAMMKKVRTLKMMRLGDIKMRKSLQQAKDDRIRKREEEVRIKIILCHRPTKPRLVVSMLKITPKPILLVSKIDLRKLLLSRKCNILQ